MKQLIYLTILIVYLSISVSSIAIGKTSGGQTEVKARLAEKLYLRIFGYTAPTSLVQVLGIRVFAQGSSDTTGYFVINDVPISPEAKEICLTTIDRERRVGFPLCISLPESDKPREIGPLLLSPTLSLSHGIIWQNQEAGASGRTVPHETVHVSFFEVAPENILDRVVAMLNKKIGGEVYAADLPVLTISSDENGAFSFNLPSHQTLGYRFYVKSEYHGNPTPKSQTLAFLIGTLGSYFLLYIVPWIIFFIIFILVITALIWYERKTNVVTSYYRYVIEKKLKPLEVQLHLRLRHESYKIQEWWQRRQR